MISSLSCEIGFHVCGNETLTANRDQHEGQKIYKSAAAAVLFETLVKLTQRNVILSKNKSASG